MNRTQAMVAVLLSTFVTTNAAAAAAPPASIVLTGKISRADHQHYRRIPFDVPASVSRLELTFEQTGRADRTVVDIGLEDPSGTRGWSGSNKDRIVIGDGTMGPVTKALHDEFFGIVNGTRPDRYNWLTPVKVRVPQPVGA